MAAEIKQKFVGKWKIDRSEHFDDFMAAMGMNFVVRKMASLAKPENEIRVEDDDRIVIATNSTFMKNEQIFKLDEPFEEYNKFAKKNFSNMPTYANGKLRITASPIGQTDLTYPEYSERELTDDGEMLLTIKVKDVLCKRYFKKVPES